MITVKPCSVAEAKQNSNFAYVAEQYTKESSIAGLPPAGEKLAAYDVLDKLDIFNAYAAFDDDKIIGFVAVLTPIIPHYGVAVAVTESLFVLEEYRSKGVGLKLIKQAEQHAKALGCPGILISAPANSKLENVMGKRKSYRHSNTVYFKEL